MKLTKKLLACFSNLALAFLLLTSASPGLVGLAGQNDGVKTAGAYEFPVKPGTPEWAALNSHDEMLKASQIPLELLKRMSTRDLVKTVLNYPLYGDMLAHNSLQEGFGRVADGFNGLKELLQRGDAGSVLLSRYRGMNPAAVRPEWSLVERGNFDRTFTYIETLLAQDAVLNSMTKAERSELIAETLLKNQLKGQFPEIYGQFGRERVTLIMGRILKRENFSPFNESVRSNPDIDSFLRDGTFTTEEVISEISSHAQHFLSIGLNGGAILRPVSLKLTEHSPLGWLAQINRRSHNAFFREASATRNLVAPDYASWVYTPRGSAVPVTVATYELSAAQIAANNNWVATYYPQAIRETDASRKYNCHSYAWYSNSIYNDRWMDSPGDDTYWNDGSFVPSYAVGATNRKVSYAYGDHSAITIDAINFRSKWGQLPRMRHAYNYCPYNSSTLYYYQQA